MTTTVRRKNLLYGVLALLVAVAVLLRLLDVFPPYIDDIIGRSAPVILVILGLSVLLRGRLPFSDVIAVVVGAALVFWISTTAFSIRQAQNREDNRVVFEKEIDSGVILLRLRLQALMTDVEIVRAPAGSADTLTTTYIGSLESEIIQNYLEDDDGSATFNLNELQVNPVPMLEDVGRGRLLVEVPPQVPVDIQLEVGQGETRLNMSGVSLERLNLDIREGDAIVTLPVYEPQYSRSDETLGTWAVSGGSLLVRVPPDVSARFDVSLGTGRGPNYDPGIYNLLSEGTILEARNFDTADIIMRYDLIVARNRLTIEVPETDSDDE
jgi:hypothetical protein